MPGKEAHKVRKVFGVFRRSKQEKDDGNRQDGQVTPPVVPATSSKSAAGSLTTDAGTSQTAKAEPVPSTIEPQSQHTASSANLPVSPVQESATTPSADDPSSGPKAAANTPAQGAAAKIQPATPIEPELLWDEAYDGLRDDQPTLVEAYEKILSHELYEKSTPHLTSDDQPNVIEQGNLEMRRSQMGQLVQKGLKKTEKEAKVKQGIGNVMQVALGADEIIKLAVQACPQAALAWTGVSLGLQVSLSPRCCRDGC
jgi:hypothetical protein